MNQTYSFIEDENGVMERLCGNEALFKRLLTKFRDTYSASRTKLIFLLDAGDKEESYRLVHSIKGVSANLGIGKLYRLSIALENRMKAHEYSNIQTETEAFLVELETVITEISN